MAGAISFVGGDFAFVPGNSSLDLDFPIFGSLAGINLSPGGTPRVKFGGQIFGGTGFSFTTENFDNILNFKDLRATDVILMIPDFLTYLDDLASITGEGFDPMEMIEDPAAETVEEIVSGNLEIQRLKELVSRLPQRERDSIRLFHLEWFSTQAIARVLGVSRARIYQNLNAGVDRLRKRVATKGGGIVP